MMQNNETKKMITKENYENYKLLSDIKSGEKMYSKTEENLKSFLYVTTVISSILLYFIVNNGINSISTIDEITEVIMNSIVGIIDVFGSMILVLEIPDIVKKVSIKRFGKEFPELNINIEKEKLDKELKKFKGKKKKYKVKSHINNMENTMKKLSTDEKIAYLEKERKFWEEIASTEKRSKEKENVLQKRK